MNAHVWPTPAERTAIRTGYAALMSSQSPNSNVVETIVFALGSAQLLQSPETAAELQRLRLRVAELEAGRGTPRAGVDATAAAERLRRIIAPTPRPGGAQ